MSEMRGGVVNEHWEPGAQIKLRCQGVEIHHADSLCPLTHEINQGWPRFISDEHHRAGWRGDLTCSGKGHRLHIQVAQQCVILRQHLGHWRGDFFPDLGPHRGFTSRLKHHRADLCGHLAFAEHELSGLGVLRKGEELIAPLKGTHRILEKERILGHDADGHRLPWRHIEKGGVVALQGIIEPERCFPSSGRRIIQRERDGGILSRLQCHWDNLHQPV